MNNLQTELKVFFEDQHTGQYSSAYYLPIVPTMTAAEICRFGTCDEGMHVWGALSIVMIAEVASFQVDVHFRRFPLSDV